MDEVFAQIADYLRDEINSEFESYREELEERATECNTYLADDCIPELADKTTEFTEHIEQIVTEITDKLKELEESTEQLAQESVDHVSEVQGERFTEVLENAQELQELMEQLGGFLNDTGDTVVTTKDVLTDAVKTTNIGTEAAVGIFEDVLSLW